MNKNFFYRLMVLSIGVLFASLVACNNPASSNTETPDSNVQKPSDNGSKVPNAQTPGGGNPNGETGNGDSPSIPTFTPVAFGTNGDDLKNWLTNTASSTEINYLKVTDIPAAALEGTTGAGNLGRIIKESGKKVALKLTKSRSTPSLKNCFKDCTNLVSIWLEYAYEEGKFDNAFAGCTGLGAGSITVSFEQLQEYQNHAADMGTLSDRFAPSSIEGVWRYISVQSQGQTITFPHYPGNGVMLQQYTCFWEGKMYEVIKSSGYPAEMAQHNGIFKGGLDWGRPYIFWNNKILNMNVTFSGNEMTVEVPSSAPSGKVIIKTEKVGDPTVEQILAAKPNPNQP